MLEHALKYRSNGLSVIPIKPDFDPVEQKFLKKPYIKWAEFQTRHPSEDEIKSWWTQFPNAMIGIVTGEISKLYAIDCDTDDAYQRVQSMLPDSFLTPTARTPRGGHHFWVKCSNGDKLPTLSCVLTNVDTRGEGGYIIAPPSKNANGGEYAWVDGLSFEEIALEEIPCNIFNIIYTRARGEPGNVERLHLSTTSTSVYNEGRRDESLFHIAHLLVKAGCESNYLYETIELIAKNCQPSFSESEAEAKIKSAIERANKKERKLSAEVREYVLSTNGVFLSTEVAKCLHLSTREELKNLSIILKRLDKHEHLIEKQGNKNGCWRTVDMEEEIIDIFNADLTPYDIKLPLKVHEYVTIHKGNVIIIAGESNAGKTSFCMNVAKMNRDNHFINYLSSEMQNGTELRVRLDEFGESIEKWRPIKFQFRTDYFPDKIMPDALNVVDYLDEGGDQEAYQMPKRIREIANKLQKGVAVIAIQKDPNKQFGYGGAGTLNRARLYITVTKQGIMTVVKGKIWKNKNINPNGMSCNYKLVAGCKYFLDGEWKW